MGWDNVMKINQKDVEFVAFKRSKGAGGQNVNKVSTAIRATHLPTGLKVECCTERFQHQNKKRALELLEEKLNNLIEKSREARKQEVYSSKGEASFGTQIRTYRMTGNAQNVTDHRTGIIHQNAKDVLDGDIDEFLKGTIYVRFEG
jgi:peptide chain release factor 2